ncbi:MAG TPA: FecR family protein [Planctomicrobium sp.]|nr:FecR family protein [Planctomicrobium sp.]
MNYRKSQNQIPLEWRDLVDRFCSGTILEEESRFLAEGMSNDPDVRDYVNRYLAMHAGLQWEFRRGGGAIDPVFRRPEISRNKSLGKLSDRFPATRRQNGLWGVMILALVILGIVVWFPAKPISPTDPHSTELAKTEGTPPFPVESPSATSFGQGHSAEMPVVKESFTIVTSPTEEKQGRHVVGKLSLSGTDVIVERNGEPQFANSGMELLAFDKLRVPQGEKASVKLANSASVELGPRSVLAFRHEGRPELLEGYAEIDATEHPRQMAWSLRTEMADAEIQTGRFSVGASSGQTCIRVAEGSVSVVRRLDGAMANIRHGFCSLISPNEDLRPVPSRYGQALLVLSEEDKPNWATFNRLIGERLIDDHLWKSALSVKVRTYDQLTADDLQGCAVVIISVFHWGTNAEDAIAQAGIPDAAIPVLCLEPAAFPVIGMTGPTLGIDYQFNDSSALMDISSPRHPLAAGFHGRGLNLFHVADKRTLGWARPTNDATRIANFEGEPEQCVLFGYEEGAQMFERKAPARRVGLFVHPQGVTASSPALKLIDAAIQWCLVGQTQSI